MVHWHYIRNTSREEAFCVSFNVLFTLVNTVGHCSELNSEGLGFCIYVFLALAFIVFVLLFAQQINDDDWRTLEEARHTADRRATWTTCWPVGELCQKQRHRPTERTTTQRMPGGSH